MNLVEIIQELYPDRVILTADGFDDAIIGFCERSDRVVYSITKCINILINEHGMSDEDAIEYFYYNVEGAYFGEHTPIFCNDNFL